MDNITHSLIGISAAEGLIGLRESRGIPVSTRDRVRLWLASTLANNLPDLDVAYTWGRDRLEYLLHHRGHTHTLLLAPFQGILLLALFWFFMRKKEGVPWRSISLLCILGPFLHLLADSWNTYGVHPFWPLDNRWRYGDLVFIIEPWLWIAFLPPIWKRSESLLGKTFSLLPFVSVLLLAWLLPVIQPMAATVLTLVALGWLGAQIMIRSPGVRLVGALGICALVFFSFAAAQARIRSYFPAGGSELVVQSYPANPVCALVFTAGYEGSSYRATAWTASALPGYLPARNCPPMVERHVSADLRPITENNEGGRLSPIGEFVAPRNDLEHIAATCRGRAFLRFARIPFWFRTGSQIYLGDLRFDRNKETGFAEIPLEGECPAREAPWVGRFFPE